MSNDLLLTVCQMLLDEVLPKKNFALPKKEMSDIFEQFCKQMPKIVSETKKYLKSQSLYDESAYTEALRIAQENNQQVLFWDIKDFSLRPMKMEDIIFAIPVDITTWPFSDKLPDSIQCPDVLFLDSGNLYSGLAHIILDREDGSNHYRDAMNINSSIVSVRTFVKYFVETLVEAIDYEKLVIDRNAPIYTDTNYSNYMLRGILINVKPKKHLNFMDIGRIISRY